MTITDTITVPSPVRVEEAYCETHGAYERRISRIGGGIRFVSECPCCEKERERERTARKRAAFLEQKQEERKRLLAFCRIEPEYYQATLEN